MARAPASVAMALVVVAAIMSTGLPAAHAGTNFISRTCRRTQDAALCVAVLTADPRSAKAGTVHGLADIALDLAAGAALENARLLNLLYFINMWTPKGQAAKVCRAAYLDATEDELLHARDSFDDGDFIGASRLVESARGAGDRCENAFREISTRSPATDANRQMTEHCVVARGLIDLLASSCCFCACSHRNF